MVGLKKSLKKIGAFYFKMVREGAGEFAYGNHGAHFFSHFLVISSRAKRQPMKKSDKKPSKAVPFQHDMRYCNTTDTLHLAAEFHCFQTYTTSAGYYPPTAGH